MSKSRVITRLVSFVFYPLDDPDHYTEGGCEVFLYGDRGFMFAISGRGFFKSFVPSCESFMNSNGLRTLEGYMSRTNARSVRLIFSNNPDFKVTLDSPREIDGHIVQWVTVELLKRRE